MVGEALDLELADDPSSIALARSAAREFADGCGADPDDLALAVSEAVTNAIIHGYRGHDGGVVELVGYREDDDCVVEVTDHGVGMRPNPGSPGLGLGLPVISALTSSVEIVSVPGGTAVRMRFPRAG